MLGRLPPVRCVEAAFTISVYHKASSADAAVGGCLRGTGAALRPLRNPPVQDHGTHPCRTMESSQTLLREGQPCAR